MRAAPDLVQLQADLAELAVDFEAMRARVAAMVECQRKADSKGMAPGGLPRAPAGVVQDGAGVHLAQD